MSDVTLQQAEDSLRVWEACAIVIGRGGEFEVNRKVYGLNEKDFVAGQVRDWRRTCIRLAVRQRADFDERFGLRRGGLGRRVIGTVRRVR